MKAIKSPSGQEQGGLPAGFMQTWYFTGPSPVDVPVSGDINATGQANVLDVKTVLRGLGVLLARHKTDETVRFCPYKMRGETQVYLFGGGVVAINESNVAQSVDTPKEAVTVIAENKENLVRIAGLFGLPTDSLASAVESV